MSRDPTQDPWDPERLRLRPEAIGSLLRPPRLPRHRRGELFLKGPIPHPWIAAACRLTGSGLHVATTVRSLCDRFGRENRWSLGEIAEALGVAERSARRGLHAAEEARLLSVSRSPGCKLTATILPAKEPENGPPKRPLYGPVPWSWWLPALRLPGASPRVATACWLVGGWEKSATFELALGAWGELGLSRQAAGCGLEYLISKGLLTASLREGRSPIVTISEPPPSPKL